MSTTQIQPRVNRKLAVEIARDVLEQLRLRRYFATNGKYCELQHTWNHTDRASFREAFRSDVNITCNVCALGSLFTSFVNLKNVFTIRQVNRPKFRNMIPALRKAFSIRDLMLMEYAFEMGCVGILLNERNRKYRDQETGEIRLPEDGNIVINFKGRHTFSSEELERVAAYGQRYEMDADKRLRIIMLNVIRNKGRFILPK